jgi:hypothetical protein
MTIRGFPRVLSEMVPVGARGSCVSLLQLQAAYEGLLMVLE